MMQGHAPSKASKTWLEAWNIIDTLLLNENNQIWIGVFKDDT